MSKPRTCPSCRAVLGMVDGYSFDSDLSLRCKICGKVVFPTSTTPLPPVEQVADFSAMRVTDDYESNFT